MIGHFNNLYIYYMKHKLLFTSIILASIAIILSLFHKSYSNPGGSPGNYTGGPGDGTCAASGCHTGTTPINNSSHVTLSTNIPAYGWTEGQTYTFTLTLSLTGNSKSGFQIGTFGGSDVGTFIASTDAKIQTSGKRATHKSSSNTGTNGRSWTFDWTAPSSSSVDSLSFYYAVNACNGNGNESGDVTHLGHTTIYRNVTGINEKSTSTVFQVYPNPIQTGSNLHISSKDLLQGHIYIYDLKGSMMLSKSFQNNQEELNTSSFNKGVYILKIQTPKKTQEQQILVY